MALHHFHLKFWLLSVAFTGKTFTDTPHGGGFNWCIGRSFASMIHVIAEALLYKREEPLLELTF